MVGFKSGHVRVLHAGCSVCVVDEKHKVKSDTMVGKDYDKDENNIDTRMKIMLMKVNIWSHGDGHSENNVYGGKYEVIEKCIKCVKDDETYGVMGSRKLNMENT